MPRVLVVDDSASVRAKLAQMVGDLGHEVAEAEDGARAVAKCESWHPHLVLLDITMPVMDGLEALQLIRERDSNVKIVMITALANQETVIQALKSGANDFLSKPATRETIERAVRTLTA